MLAIANIKRIGSDNKGSKVYRVIIVENEKKINKRGEASIWGYA